MGEGGGQEGRKVVLEGSPKVWMEGLKFKLLVVAHLVRIPIPPYTVLPP